MDSSTSGSIVDYNKNNNWTQGVSGVVVNNGEMIFNGASHLQTPAINDWNLGASNFTMEFEVLFDSTATSTFQGLLSKRQATDIQCSFTTMWNNNSGTGNYNNFLFNFNSSGSEYSSLISEVKSPIAKDTYIKISITRAYKKIYFHINGNLVTQQDINDSLMYWSTQYPILLGVLNSGSKTDRYFKGKIKHLRVLKGIALYNAESYTDFKELDKPTGGSAFTPNNLVSKPVIYLDSSKANFAADATVTSWIDQNNLHVFDTSTTNRRPLLASTKLNNLSVINFDGSKALYNNTQSAKSIFRKTDFVWSLVVFRKGQTFTTDQEAIICAIQTNSGSYERYGLRVNYSADYRNRLSHGERILDSDVWTGKYHSRLLDNDWTIGLSVLNYKTGKSILFINGDREETTLPSSGITSDTDSVNYFTIGNHPGGGSLSFGFIGDIATLITGNREITSEEMDKLIGWAAHNYDLTRLLPNDHPYKTVAPTTVDKYDPYYENVYALFPFEKDLLDTTNKIWSVEGNPAISQEKAILGNSSAKFTGTASSVYINQLLRNNDTFTIDFWAYILNDSTGNASNTWHTVAGQSGSGGAQDQFFGIEGGTTNTRRVLFSRQTVLANAIDVQSTLTVPDNQWNHIELSWDGIAYRLFVNGVLDKVANCPIGWLDTGYPFRIGRNFNPSYPQYVSGIQGYLKYFRVTKGIVRHKSSFVPPTTVAEYNKSTSIKEYDQYWNNVTLLLKGDGADGSTDIIDSSKLNLPVKTRLGVTVKANQSKFDQSLFYPATGTGNILLYDWNENLHLNGDFTIDFWYYPTGAGGQILNMGGGINIAWPSYQVSWDYNDNKSICFAASSTNSNIDIGGETGPSGKFGEPTLNAWNHIEITRQGNQWRCFLNGALGLSITSSNNPYNSTPRGLQVGGRYDYNWNSGTPGSSISGYIDNLRITKGVARHVSNFTPPTNTDQYSNVSISTTKDFRNRALELQPIGYWPLDDNSGTVARDISGNGFHGNIAWGTPTFNAPRLRAGSSKSMGFLDGTGCLQIPIEQAGSLISGLNATGKEFTIIYLEQATKTTTQNIGLCGFKNPFSGDYALRLISGNTLQAKGSGDVTITGLELNKTRFIAWKKDFQQGLFKALVNGVWYNGGTVNPATAGDTFSYPLMLPGSGDQSYNHYPINGYYSDLIIFNKALSDSQIEELYALLDRPAVLPDAEDIVPSNLKMALIGNSLDFEASTNAMPITVNGNVSIIPNGGRDTDSLKFAAGSSLEFNYPDVFNIGSKPFAVEFDVNLTSGFGSTNGTEQAPIITNITSANGLSYEWFIGIGNAYAKIYYGIRGSAYSEVTLPWPDGITLTPGVKYTVVIQRDTEGKVCCYLNGKRGTKYRLTPWGSAPVPGSDVDGLYTMNVNFGNIGKPIRVGNFLDSYQLLGELSNLKVYIGQHLYNNSTYKLPEASGRKQFRYYKMNILSGMSSWTELQEMELATTVNGKDVTTPTTPVTAIGYYNSGAEVMKPEGLVDNNLTDPDKGAWSHSSASYPQWVTFDLGQPLRLDEVRIMGRNKSGYYDRGPKQFEIQGSNDNSSWAVLNTLTANDTYKSLTYKRFRLTPIKYRYYKMEIFGTEGGDGYTGIGRVLYGLNNVIITTSLNTKVSASSFYSSNPVTNLIKSDNPQNGDDAWASSTPTLPQWIIHDFGNATEIDQIRMIPQLSPHNQRAPKFFRILGSNDGAIWDTIKDFRNVTGWTSGAWNILSLTDQDEDKSTVALVQFNETAGATTLVDSTGLRNWTVNHGTLGNGVLTCSSNSFETNAIVPTNPTDFAFGRDPFTFEFLIQPTKITSNYGDCILYWQDANSGSGLGIMISGDGYLEIRNSLSNRGTQMLAIDTTRVNHLAICRVGGTVFISCNGVTVSKQFDFGNITSTSDIGVARGGSYGYIGTVDAVRIKRGVALYTGTSYKVPLTLK